MGKGERIGKRREEGGMERGREKKGRELGEGETKGRRTYEEG